jgi:hypothetical protein
MPTLRGKYAPLGIWLAVALAIFTAIFVVTHDGRIAAMYINGVTVNLFDPLVWIIAFVPAVKSKRGATLFASLLLLSIVLTAAKIYMQRSSGSAWITGSILGNLVGFVTVGYLINAASTFRKARRQPANEGGA